MVVANVPSGVAFPDGINYSWFADAQNAMDLETQSPQTNGLFMSGEGTVSALGQFYRRDNRIRQPCRR